MNSLVFTCVQTASAHHSIKYVWPEDYLSICSLAVTKFRGFMHLCTSQPPLISYQPPVSKFQMNFPSTSSDPLSTLFSWPPTLPHTFHCALSHCFCNCFLSPHLVVIIFQLAHLNCLHYSFWTLCISTVSFTVLIMYMLVLCSFQVFICLA